jgi:outer membrane protein TolC
MLMNSTTPHSCSRISVLYAGVALAAGLAAGQAVQFPNAATLQAPGAPATLTLQDALSRARMNAPQLLSTLADANAAHEDLLQARGAIRPSLSGRSEYLGSEGNGKLASSRFVTNDGVHVYRDWAIVHQDFTAALTRTGIDRATATEAIARAKAEVTRRGLDLTVTRAYYALLAGQRKYATAQQALDQAKRYFEISKSLRRGGEVAHSDEVRAEIQVTSQEQAYREAQLTMDTARLDLAVLVSPDFNLNFTIVDDLTLAPALPPLEETRALAERENPDLAVASGALKTAGLDVKIARQAYLPSLTADLAYGIEANAFALRSTVAAAPKDGKLPNLGYFLTVSLNVPVWDWGARASKMRQAEIKRDQAKVELTAAQRGLLRNLQGAYQEAQVAREQAESLRHTVDLSVESLRLTGLRYQGGEATILELVDAQTLLIQSRNSYDDALVRYRVALSNLQTLTGPF